MSPAGPKQRLGNWGERLALDYLEARGYILLARNLRTPYGEIDLVMDHGGVTVFVEVKTRSGTGYGMPEEAVNRAKQEHLLAAIAYYWQQSGAAEGDWRVDVIAVVRKQQGKEVDVEHFENAIG